MSELDTSLAGVHAAVAALLATADRVGSAWKVPRAPGKWSPSQVVEHVTRLMDESAKVAAGEPSAFPTVNRFVRPIARLFVFKRILRRKSFLKMKTIEPLDPQFGSPTPKEARVRLESVFSRFDHACRIRAASGEKVASSIFGPVSVADFVRYQELHVRHHQLQLPGAA